jgi:hypothetical protein
MSPEGEITIHPPPEYNCIQASRLIPAVKPWEWGVCTGHTRQDWFGFVVLASSVENEPGVMKVMQRRAEQRQKELGPKGKGGGQSSTFVINRGQG